jgi:hypothetical protein
MCAKPIDPNGDGTGRFSPRQCKGYKGPCPTPAPALLVPRWGGGFLFYDLVSESSSCSWMG